MEEKCLGVPITVHKWQCMIWTDKLVTLWLPWSSLQALFLCSTTISAVMHWSGVTEKLCTVLVLKRKEMQMLSGPSFVLTFLPALFYKGSSTFRTGSLLSCARIMKVTLFLLCGWVRGFSQAVMRSRGTFAVGTAEAGGDFCLWATPAHCDGVCRVTGIQRGCWHWSFFVCFLFGWQCSEIVHIIY